MFKTAIHAHQKPPNKGAKAFFALALTCLLGAFATPAQADTAVASAYVSKETVTSWAAAHSMLQDIDYTPTLRPDGNLAVSCEDRALDLTNLYRVAAGVNEVTLDATYTETARAASSLLESLGYMSHTPERPANISDLAYNQGYLGASTSNLVNNTPNIFDALKVYIQDPGERNANVMGHRRWMLSPLMKKTGFSVTGGTNVMHVVDDVKTPTTTKPVAWPVPATPKVLFAEDSAWSLSLPKDTDAQSVQVTMTRDDGQTYHFSAAGADGTFAVDNEDLGDGSSIIFKPFDTKGVMDHDWVVRITGTPLGTVSWRVGFFNLNLTPHGPDTTFKATPATNLSTQHSITYGTSAANETITVAGGPTDPFFPTSATNGTNENSVTLTRLLNPYTGEHLFSTDANEIANLKSQGWQEESISASVFATDSDAGIAVHRLFNPYTKEHLYTANETEIASLISAGWRDEGVVWRAAGPYPLYRLFNPYADTLSSHLLTTDRAEYETLADKGWVAEGQQLYVLGSAR